MTMTSSWVSARSSDAMPTQIEICGFLAHEDFDGDACTLV